MDRKTWLTTLIILTSLVLTADYLFIHILFPEKKKAFLQKIFASATQLDYSLPLPTGLKTNYPAFENAGEDNFESKLQDCFSDTSVNNSKSPKDLLENLEKAFQIKKRVFHLENLHFLNSSNEEFRLNAAPISAQHSEMKEIHLFKIGPNHLPTPVDIDPTQIQNPTAEFLHQLLSGTTIIYHQLKETILLGNENLAIVEWVNENVETLQTVGDKKTLTCYRVTCACE